MKIFMYSLREFDELKYCNRFKKEMGIDFAYTTEYPSLDNAILAKGYDAVSSTPCSIPASLIRHFHEMGVKYITCRSIGYDHVDLKAAKEYGMRVSNVSYKPDGVANYAIMMMLMCLRKMTHILKRAELQDFSLKGKLGRDISSCTVGIIGTGKIGTTVIEHLSGFKCKIYAYDKYQNPNASRYAEYVDLNTLFRESDIISLHINASDENYHLIDDTAISNMKTGAIIINTARGRLIDELALIHGLETGKIGAAGLDVLENEDGLYYYNHTGDVLYNHNLAILRSFPNVILSPHTAFYTEDDVCEMVKGCFESLKAFELGTETIHEVPFNC